MAKFEKLLDKLIKEKKIDKLDIMRRLGEPSVVMMKNQVLEEKDSSLSNDLLLDDQIMNEEDS